MSVVTDGWSRRAAILLEGEGCVAFELGCFRGTGRSDEEPIRLVGRDGQRGSRGALESFALRPQSRSLT